MGIKFNWKSRKVIASFITILLTGFGVVGEQYYSEPGAAVVCTAIKCDA